MKIQGRNLVAAPRQRVWDALSDPAVLARTLPGCRALEVVDDGHCRATVTAGVASIRGTWTGDVRLADVGEPASVTLAARGAGQAGTIEADVDVVLAEDSDMTAVSWDTDTVVDGMIAGVGQRMLAGVAQRMAGEFFDNLEADILADDGRPGQAGGEVGDPAVKDGTSADAALGNGGMTDGGDGGAGTVGRAGADGATASVLSGRVARDGARGTVQLDDTTRLVGAFLLGAVVGVLVGRRIT